ncbi:MAG: hypothetical protein J5382_04640 [Bacteroidales bacterium]|nr:hypothetical protein [Bacteroidales bacterium]
MTQIRPSIRQGMRDLWKSYKAWRRRREREEIKALKARLSVETGLRKRAEHLAISIFLNASDSSDDVHQPPSGLFS